LYFTAGAIFYLKFWTFVVSEICLRLTTVKFSGYKRETDIPYTIIISIDALANWTFLCRDNLMLLRCPTTDHWSHTNALLCSAPVTNIYERLSVLSVLAVLVSCSRRNPDACIIAKCANLYGHDTAVATKTVVTGKTSLVVLCKADYQSDCTRG